jgi:hypothetical protein
MLPLSASWRPQWQLFAGINRYDIDMTLSSSK